MRDPIERQDVLNLIRKTHMPEEISMQFLYQGVKELPTIGAKRGKWKYEGCDTYSCPFCGDTHVDDGDIYYFCKVCGADMKG